MGAATPVYGAFGRLRHARDARWTRCPEPGGVALAAGPVACLLACPDQVDERLGVVGIARDRPAIALHRLVGAPETPKHGPAVGKLGGIAPVDGDRPVDEVERVVVTSRLVNDDAELIEDVGLPRLRRQHLAVERLGLGKRARLVQPHRADQLLGDRRGRGAGRRRRLARLWLAAAPRLMVHWRDRRCGAWSPIVRLLSASAHGGPAANARVDAPASAAPARAGHGPPARVSRPGKFSRAARGVPGRRC